ncbi:MAG: beta-L-arabinofuranosidase domain-containing protein [Saprospiraceae bacterium]
MQAYFCFGQAYTPQKNNPGTLVKPLIPINAFSFDLKDVRLLPGSPFKNAMDKDLEYLLSIDPLRLLHRFYKNADLPTHGEIYGGWEKEGLSGHTLGHYLSACAMMYAGTDNPELIRRVNTIVDELEKCQIARKTGYIGAIPNEDTIFAKVARGDIKTSGFDLNGGWSPWYTVHKVMAGLLDAYVYTQNKKALGLVTGMADWTYNTIDHLPDSSRLKMLRCEYGGMNDVLASIYAVTGNKKYLDLSYKFYDDFVMQPLSEKIDPMPGKHSNTNVPKAIGSATQYELTGNERDKTIASFFWQTMVHHHSYVIGGNSSYEYCGEEDKLNDRLSDNTCETCNTYNMLKLTRHLFTWNPDAKFMDYYERALYNHILASQNPENGMMCYFVPLRMGTKKSFSNPFNTFTCCVGTGMENHAKYTESIYFEGNDGSLFVNLFIPSQLNWKEKKVLLIQETKFPDAGQTSFTIQSKKPRLFTIRIRHPWWAFQPVTATINGKVSSLAIDSNGYFSITRKWKNNVRLEIKLPMELYSESIPDNKNRIAFLYGPLVLAGQLGDTIPDPVYGIPVLLTDDKNPNHWMNPINGNGVAFKMHDIAQPFNTTLIPFYKTVDQHYTVYWDYFSAQDWAQKKTNYEEEKRILKAIEASTIDHFRIGEMQPERDHKLKASERSYVSDALGVKGREARTKNFFEFQMQVDRTAKNTLLLTYIGDDKDRKFDILINEKPFTTVEWKGGEANKFFNIEYPLPESLVMENSRITIRIEANYGTTTARIFGARTVKN